MERTDCQKWGGLHRANTRSPHAFICVKATVGLDIHTVTLTKHSGPDGNKKGDVPLGNPTLPEDSTGIAESPA